MHLFYQYTLEIRLGGKFGCTLCAKVGRYAKTPNIFINSKNIRDEVLQWMDLTVVDQMDKARFLFIEKIQSYIDKKIHL